MTSMIFFAQTAPPGQPPALFSFLPLVLMFLIFYFLLIRPQQKRQREHQQFTQNLEKNQEVVTAGGLHGTVVQVKETTVVLRVADSVRVEIDKSSITRAKKTQGAS